MAKSFSKVNAMLIKADIMFFSALGLIEPLFAVYITQQIKGGDIKIVGFAAAIYLITKSLIQIPVSKFLDKTKGEKDDLYFLVFGLLLAALVPFGYIYISVPWHIYILQLIYALGMAMAYPAWCGIFTRHINKGKEAFEWGIYNTAVDLGIGLAGAIGGILVSELGFDLVFLVVGIIAVIGAILPLAIKKDLLKKQGGYLKFLGFRRPFF